MIQNLPPELQEKIIRRTCASTRIKMRLVLRPDSRRIAEDRMLAVVERVLKKSGTGNLSKRIRTYISKALQQDDAHVREICRDANLDTDIPDMDAENALIQAIRAGTLTESTLGHYSARVSWDENHFHLWMAVAEKATPQLLRMLLSDEEFARAFDANVFEFRKRPHQTIYAQYFAAHAMIAGNEALLDYMWTHHPAQSSLNLCLDSTIFQKMADGVKESLAGEPAAVFQRLIYYFPGLTRDQIHALQEAAEIALNPDGAFFLEQHLKSTLRDTT
jgi:hypothetical protein